MKSIIKFDFTTYIFLILSLLSASFKNVIILLFIIIIHEFGHIYFLKIFNKKIINIKIYPFGGITTYESLVNHNLSEEIFISLGGIITQILLFIPIILLYNFSLISNYTFKLFISLNSSILLFNILPIIPLDGSKVLNIILESFFSYHLSNNILIIISSISLSIFILLIISKKINNLIIIAFIQNKKYLENRFLLERFLYQIPYKKIRYNNHFNKNMFMQEVKHYINYEDEKKYLANMFDKH